MRTALAAAAMLAMVGCKQQVSPAATATVYEWTQQSADGRFELRQRQDGTGCRVQAVVKSQDGDRPLWSTQTCLPTKSGMAFLSPNGEKVLVLDLFPSVRAAQSSDWSQVALISLWSRGAVIRQYTGAEILAADRAANMSKVLSWVRGDTLEDARRSTQASADGERVTIQLVDGRALTVGFEGNALQPPAAERPVHSEEPPSNLVEPASASLDDPAPPTVRATPDAVRTAELPRTARTDGAQAHMAQDEVGLYSWEDERGELHMGSGSQVPAKYRSRARPVDATVGVVGLDAPTPASTAPAGEPGKAAPAAPGAPKPPPPGTAGQPKAPEGGSPPAPPAQ